MNVTPSTSPGLLLCPDTMEEDSATPPTQHATLYLVHRRTLVHWLLDVSYLNPLSQIHPFLTVHRAVALFDHLIAIPQLPHLCAVSTARLPLMAVACLSIASREGALGALSPTLLNKICEERYSEAIIVKMDALLTQILRLTRQPFTTTTTQHNDHNHEKEKEGDEEEREREVEGLRETLTSRDWVEIFHATSQEGEDIQRQMSLMVLKYANLLCDSFLAEGTCCSIRFEISVTSSNHQHRERVFPCLEHENSSGGSSCNSTQAGRATSVVE